MNRSLDYVSLKAHVNVPTRDDGVFAYIRKAKVKVSAYERRAPRPTNVGAVGRNIHPTSQKFLRHDPRLAEISQRPLVLYAFLYRARSSSSIRYCPTLRRKRKLERCECDRAIA